MRALSLLGSVVAAMLLAAPVAAQDAIPAKRLTIFQNADLPGSDIHTYFDSTYEACANACLANSSCVALTFNQRANACFLKGDVAQISDFQGAVSALAFQSDPAVIARGEERALTVKSLLGLYAVSNARQFTLKLGEEFHPGEWSVEQLLEAGAEARGNGDLRDAVLFVGAAMTISDRADIFTDYAEMMLDYPGSDSQRRTNREKSVNAAVAAFLRASSPAEQVNALLVLAKGLEVTNRQNDILPVLRHAESVQSRADVQEALRDARSKYGFRITENRVDSDLASPRICATFSEEVLSGGSDYADYVTVDQGAAVVTSEGRDVCVEGLEHGRSYEVTFRPGMLAASGEVLITPATLRFYVRDRSPVVWFPGRGYILPATGEVSLPLTGVNVEEVELSLSKVSDRNLIRAIQNDYFGQPIDVYQREYLDREVAEKIWEGTGQLETELNREVTTRLPLDGVLEGLDPGIYMLAAQIPGLDPWDFPAATQWFVVSDLGLTSYSGNDGLHVFARSLGSAEGKAGAEVELISRANAVLATATTDAEGYVRFDAGLTRGRGGAEPSMLVIKDGEDLSFLPLSDPEFDLSDRGVEGREAAGPIDVFLTTDRGIYRAGETINVTALARDSAAKALSGLPMTAVLYRPDGVEYSRVLASGDMAGGYVFNLPVAGNVQRGTWRLDLLSDPKAPALASQRVLVEDFLPERIDFEITADRETLIPGETVALNIDAKYLFGAAGADLNIAGSIMLRETRSLDAFPGFVFGRHDQTPISYFDSLPYGEKTDFDGQATLVVDVPELEEATAPLTARFAVEVAEGSGRPVERRLTLPVTAGKPVIGIKPSFDGDQVAENARAGFQLIALDAGLAPMPMKVKWTVSRVRTEWRWFRMYGYWDWERVTSREKVAEDEATLGDAPVSIEAQVKWGEYELRVERADGDYASASMSFYGGWYGSGDASLTPDMLEAGLDKPSYQVGDTAVLRIVPRYAGKALVTVLTDRVIERRVVDVTEGENQIEVAVTEDWGAGAYVTASVIRPMDTPAGQMPARAMGLSYAKVDPGKRQLDVSIELAGEVDPRGPMPVAVKVENITAGETAYVTLAAVDLGILNLTGYASPDPSSYYFGQRKLGVGIRDVYGRLIDSSQGVIGQIRSGGDGMARTSMENPPPTEELVAYFSGPIEVGADGYARHTFDIPSFNGAVRVMAVAWSTSGVGEAEAEALIRDPVVVTASVPRFIAPGDQSRLLLEVVHAFGPSGEMALDVTTSGVALAGSAPASVVLADGGKAVLSVPFRAGEPGLALLDITLTTPDGKALQKQLKLPVQVNDPEVARTSRFDLASGQTFTLDDNIFAGMIEGSGTATVSVGPLAYLDAPGLLVALDRYPYGCTEQTTSRAMPLLYLSSLAKALGLEEKEDLQTRIDLAIQRVLSNQSSNGSFGLWYADSGDFWLDAYVSDFLSRARAQGYKVPDRAFRSAVDNLRNQVNSQANFDKGGEALAYALLVLAREGAATIGDLRYYADQKADAFSTALAQAQIGAALAMYGDTTRADFMFRKAVGTLGAAPEAEAQVWRADYGTNLRDAAAVLALAAESGSNAVDRNGLAARIAAPQQSRPLSTQEQVWSLLAANALATGAGAEGITIDGAPMDGPLVKVIEQGTAGGLAMAVKNGSGRDTVVTLTTFGVPEVPEPAGGNGYEITREYFTLDGEPIDPSSVASGTRMAVRISVQSFGSGEARLLVADPLPAGFEIDNPNLLQAGDISALDWLDLNGEARHTEFRQDRFIAQVDWRKAGSFRLAYIVRAISPGTYRHPAASVEDMYRPQYRAHTDTGSVTVAE